MFDYVIIDAPPLGVVIDAVIIGKYTDGAVIVIEQGVIKRKIVQTAQNPKCLLDLVTADQLL